MNLLNEEKLKGTMSQGDRKTDSTVASKTAANSRGRQGGGNRGVMGAGSLREAGEERAGDRISKGVGSGRNRKGAGTGSTGYGKREIHSPPPQKKAVGV